MLRIALLALVVACKSKAPEPKQPPPVIADAAVVVPLDAAPPAPNYRTDTSKPRLDPAVAGEAAKGMVASDSVDASNAGKAILAAGGNAVDAAVATALALAVAHPQAGNLGGGGFAIVRTGPGKSETLDFRETAPQAATTEMYVAKDGTVTKDSLLGPLASGTPGSVAGLFELHRKYGKRPWATLVAPAIALARDGFTITKIQEESLARAKEKLAKFPVSAAIWVPNGEPLRAGVVVKQPDLAVVLERIAKDGAKGFYTGPTAKLIVEEMQRGNGIITLEDLASYRAIWRIPLRFDYRGYHLFSMPPPSSGGVVLAMTANILSRVDLGKLPWHGADHIHWLVEAWRRGYAARNELLGDPDFVKNPVDKLISKAFADEVAKTIGPRATASKDMPSLVEGQNTTNFVVADASGMAVGITTTINSSWGSGVTVTGAGFLMNNEMDDFTAKPGSPNTYGLMQGTANKIMPKKRMLSSMAPTIVEDAKGNLVMVLGVGRGGPRIITGIWQTLSNIVDFGMAPDAAIGARRIHFQHLPDHVNVELEAIDAAAAKDLGDRGYTLDWKEPEFFFATANVIVKTATGYRGSSDPRGGGAAVGD